MYCSMRGAMYAMRCDRQLFSRCCTVDGGEGRGTRPGPVPVCLVCPGFCLGLYDLSSGRTLSDGALFSIIFFFRGSARFAHPLTGEHLSFFFWGACYCLSACLGLLRDEQPATRGDATVIEFMQHAARSHAGAGLAWHLAG